MFIVIIRVCLLNPYHRAHNTVVVDYEHRKSDAGGGGGGVEPIDGGGTMLSDESPGTSVYHRW